MGALWKFEQAIHWAVWTGSCIYSLYCFCLASRNYLVQLDPADFKPGWSFLSAKQDISDYEWITFKDAWNRYWFWIVGQCLSSIILRELHFSLATIMCHNTLISFFFMIVALGYNSLILYVLNVTVCLLASLTGSKLASYIVPILSILTQTIYNLNQDEHVIYSKNLFQSIIFEVGLGWLNMRCLSFSVDRINNSKSKFGCQDLIYIYSYCFYLPCFFTGPIAPFYDYEAQNTFSKKSIIFTNPFRLSLNIVRYTFYYYAIEIVTHYCYSTAFQFYPDLADQLDSWTLCGLGYALPCVFYLKYKLVYGFMGLISEAQGVMLPPPPKCVSRGHLSSFLWKHFDRGLYLWILRYLYLPLIGLSKNLPRRVLSSTICFAFMAMWHGLHYTINVWSLLNYAGVTLEMTGTVLGKIILDKLNWHPSDMALQRLRALAGAPFFMHMCITNIFFLSNYEVGILFWKKIVFGFPIPLLSTLFIMYCGSHVSLDFKKYEERHYHEIEGKKLN